MKKKSSAWKRVSISLRDLCGERTNAPPHSPSMEDRDER